MSQGFCGRIRDYIAWSAPVSGPTRPEVGGIEATKSDPPVLYIRSTRRGARHTVMS